RARGSRSPDSASWYTGRWRGVGDLSGAGPRFKPGRCGVGAIVMASIFAFSPIAFAPQAKDPEDVLTTYLGDLEKAVKNTTSKNLADRAKLETAAKLSFDRELSASTLAVPKLLWDYQNKHLDNL